MERAEGSKRDTVEIKLLLQFQTFEKIIKLNVTVVFSCSFSLLCETVLTLPTLNLCALLLCVALSDTISVAHLRRWRVYSDTANQTL